MASRMNLDVPCFPQNLRGRPEVGDILMDQLNGESLVWTGFVDSVNFDVRNAPGFLFLIPEIYFASIESSVDPGKENPVLVWVIGCKITGYDSPGRCSQRVNVATALEQLSDARRWLLH